MAEWFKKQHCLVVAVLDVDSLVPNLERQHSSHAIQVNDFFLLPAEHILLDFLDDAYVFVNYNYVLLARVQKGNS